jgi:NAD(P)-dependent dehydrogenase (short-subunit alcohol dehydrogenase family)
VEGWFVPTTVVVGAAQGIGEAVARRLAQEDWSGTLVLGDVDVERARSVAADLRGQGVDAVAHAIDVRSPESIESFLAAASDAERVAIVAGIFSAASSLEVERPEFERILDVNLVGAFYVAQGFARQMVARRSGAICAVGSIAARVPRMRQAAYAASKAGMRQALRVLALETVPSGVRINFVAPGPTDTPMMRQLSKDHPNVDLRIGSPEAFRPPVPDGRVATPADIAAAVAFLLSPDADHIAMHDLFVDGGESLGL